MLSRLHMHNSCRRVLVMASKRRLMSSFQASSSYLSAFNESMDNKDKFWNTAAQDIDWIEPYSQVYDGSSSPFEKWFPGGTLNTCFNCVDRHVQRGLGSSPAIIFDSPVSDTQEIISYSALQDKVQRLSGVMVAQGVKKGDVVVIYM